MPLAPPDTPMDRALLLMTEKRFGCLGVIDATGRLIGIVTDGDLRRAMGPDLLSRRIVDVMTTAPRTIAPDALAGEALHAMNARERPITSLFVVDAAGPATRHPPHPRPAARGGRMSISPAARPPVPRQPGQRLLNSDRRTRSASRLIPAAWPAGGLSSISIKWLLPTVALLLLATIALWPEIDRLRGSVRVAYERMGGEVGGATVTDARYRGVDEQGRPYTLTAATAEQVGPERINLTTLKADMTLADGTWLMLQSKHGVFLQHAHQLDLSHDVDPLP